MHHPISSRGSEGELNVCPEDKTIIPKEYKAKHFKYFKQLSF